MSSSTNELVPLFPSATHPAIPIAAQLLSTLRNLTAPGKGNDLRPEERAALVGIAAMLGCEKIQSKDLPLASAQKASSVSPAHFRSALARCRTLLTSTSSGETGLSHSKRSPRKGGQSPSKRSDSEIEPSSSAASSSSAQSPFQTPKKKFKFSSGIDISGLVRTPKSVHGHEPATASPLRHSVTPSTSRVRLDQEDSTNNREDEEVDQSEVEVATPTKKIKYFHPIGVDLEHPPPSAVKASTSTRKKREDASAFFALRPGTNASISAATPNGQEVDREGEDAWLLRRPEDVERRRARVRKDGERSERKKVKVKKVDWTYSEKAWGSERGRGSAMWDKIWHDLPIWLESHNRPTIEETSVRADNVVDTILNSSCDDVEGGRERTERDVGGQAAMDVD